MFIMYSTIDWEIFAVKIFFRQLLRWQKLKRVKIKRANMSYMNYKTMRKFPDLRPP